MNREQELLAVIARLRGLCYDAVGLLRQGQESGEIDSHLPEVKAWTDDLGTPEYGAGLPVPEDGDGPRGP